MAITQIPVPDIGDFSDVAIIEVYVHVGDTIAVDDPVVSLESAKAVTDIPSTIAGTITAVHVKEGDLVSKGSILADIETVAAAEDSDPVQPTSEKEPEKQSEHTDSKEIAPVKVPETEGKEPEPPPENTQTSQSGSHATPSVRRYARELGVALASVTGTGAHGRILREDVQSRVKKAIAGQHERSLGAEQPLEDFSVYGTVERRTLTRIQKISGPHLQHSWQTIPLVTQFDEADVTELEQFRQTLKEQMQRQPKEQQVKISILPFVILAVTKALKEFPEFNASYDAQRGELILKRYYHIGIAVDTPDGLMVPVLRDADGKSVREIAEELAQLSQRSREGKLKRDDISGASFSISSLGGIGGTAFTPIINHPESAILGLSKIEKKPVWNGETFIPRDILPLSLSYDHRVIDGALGARFSTYLSSLLHDIRRVLL